MHEQTNASEEMIKWPFMTALFPIRYITCSHTRDGCASARSYESFISAAGASHREMI